MTRSVEQKLRGQCATRTSLKRRGILMTSVMLVVLGAAAPTRNESISSPPYVEGEVIVKFKESTPPSTIQAMSLKANARVKGKLVISGAELWRINGLTVEEAVALFENAPGIDYVEPNYLLYLDSTYPNDPRFSDLWGLHNTGEHGGVKDADIDAPAAWDIVTGGDVLVGIVDTGVDYNHEDLADHIFVNEGEIPDNGIDDDENGFIDDVRGWDFVEGDNDPMDDHGHGTHVSGTIAAVGNNGIGIVGVSWTARILPLRIFSASGAGSVFWGAQAIEYATMMGARVTNNSWSGNAQGKDAVQRAIEKAREAGCLVITSAGNSRLNVDRYGAIPQSLDLDNIIAVANTTIDDRRHIWSSYGPVNVDLGAPGTRVLSCTLNNTYSFFTGTSMSCPHVVGAVTLIWSAAPQLSYLQVKDLILSTVDPLPELQNITVTGGRLNIRRALEALDRTAPGAVSDLTASALSNRVSLEWTSTGDDGLDGRASTYEMRRSVAPIDETNFEEAQIVSRTPAPGPPGTAEAIDIDALEFDTTYYFALKVLDETGNVSALSNVASVKTGTAGDSPDLVVTPTLVAKTLVTGRTHSASVSLENNGDTDFHWRARLHNTAYLPGVSRQAGMAMSDDFPVPGYPHPSLLDGVAILFDLSHGQIQDSWDLVIDDLRERGATVLMNAEPITEGLLDNADILWLTDAYVFDEWTDDELEALVDWVWMGGGLLIEGDDEPSLITFNRILGELRAGIEMIAQPGSPGGSSIVNPHPTTRELVAVGLESNLARLSTIVSPAEVLIVDSGGYTAAAATSVGSGNIVVLADEVFEDVRIQASRIAAEDNRLFSRQVFEWLAHPLWIRLTPHRGVVPAGGVGEIAITLDARSLGGGFYDVDVILENVVTPGESGGLKARLGVASAPDIDLAADEVEFGLVYRGYSAKRTVRVFNSGTEVLLVTRVETDSPDFVPELSAFPLRPGEGFDLDVVFNPSIVGAVAGQLTLTTNDPNETIVPIPLRGLGLDPPEIQVTPEQISEVLYSDENSVKKITVTNTGLSDLSVVPSIEGAAEPAPEAPASDDPVSTVLEEWPPATASNVQRALANQTSSGAEQATVFFEEDYEDGDFDGWIDVGSGKKEVTDATAANFTMYSYHEYESTEGHSDGVIVILDEQKPSYISVHIRPQSTTNSDGYFVLRDGSTSVIFYVFFSRTGKIAVNAGQPGQEFSIPYDARRWYWFEFKNVDFESKRFDYYLDKKLIKSQIPFFARATGGGIRTLELYNFGQYAEAWWDEIMFSNGDSWLSVAPPSATIPPGGTVDLELRMDAATQTSGNRRLEVLLSSNDPVTPEVHLPVELDVLGAPNLYVTPRSIDFGAFPFGVKPTVGLDLFNVGFELDVVIDATTSDPPVVAVDPATVTLAPRETQTVSMRLDPVAAGPLSGNLTITSNDRDEGTLIIPFTAEVLEPPVLTLSADSIVQLIESGQKQTRTLTIKNDGKPGALDLEMDIQPRWVGGTPKWMDVNPKSASVPPGDSLDVLVDWDAEGLNAQQLAGWLEINHNVPGSPTIVPVALTVYGIPAIQLADSLEFGEVYAGFPTSLPLIIGNTGSDTLFVSDITTDTPEYSGSPSSLTIAPAGGDTVTVTLNSNTVGPADGVLTVHSNDPSSPMAEVSLLADVLPSPLSTVTPMSIDVTLGADESKLEFLVLKNEGLSELRWSVDLSFASDNPTVERVAPAADRPGITALQTGAAGASLVDVLWYEDHGLGGFPGWSKLRSDIAAMGGTVTQSFAPLTADQLMAFDVLWLGDLEEPLSSGERQAIIDWSRAGGGLLIEAGNALARTEYGTLLDELGANLAYGVVPARSGLARVDPHEISFGVQTLSLLNPSARVGSVDPPTHLLVFDIYGVPVGANATVDRGRVFVITDQIFHDFNIDRYDNRLFARQVIEWLCGIRWLSIGPLEGGVAPGDSTEIGLTFEPTGFSQGTYHIDVEIATNDPATPKHVVPLAMNVSGPVLVSRIETFVPKHDALYQNAPNPFNPVTTIQFDVARQSHVALTVFDVSGRPVRRIVNQNVPAGRYEVDWDGRTLAGSQVASGVYFYRLEVGEFVTTKKMVLLK